MKDTRREHPEEERILAGGQGREAGEIALAGEAFFWCALIALAAICVLILGGCAASARPRADSERPEKPEWEELRQQMGF